MAASEPKRYFSPKAAVIGAVAASLVAFPVLLLDLFQILVPVRLVTPTREVSITSTKTTQGVLPPLLTGLVELEYQKGGVNGVVDLMKQVDSRLYRDFVYAYLITMLLGQNADIRGIEIYQPNPLNAAPMPFAPNDALPVYPAPVSTHRFDDEDRGVSTRRASFVQDNNPPAKSSPKPSIPRPDKAQFDKASELAQLMSDENHKIFMLVKIAKVRAAIDNTAPFDEATKKQAVAVLNRVQQYLVGYQISSADANEIARQLEHDYADLHARSRTPAAIRKEMRVKASHCRRIGLTRAMCAEELQKPTHRYLGLRAV